MGEKAILPSKNLFMAIAVKTQAKADIKSWFCPILIDFLKNQLKNQLEIIFVKYLPKVLATQYGKNKTSLLEEQVKTIKAVEL